jgi:HPt (histidine-containing phosphotransfer) domain-containing protein
MDDFLTKPFDPEQMIRVVRQHVELSQVPPGSVRQRAADLSRLSVWPDLPGIDRALAQQGMVGDLALLTRCLGRLLSEFGEWCGTQAASPDRASLAARMHKLAGASGMIGAKRVQLIAAAIEDRAHRADDAAVDALLPELAERLTELEGAVAVLDGLRQDTR